MDINGFSPSRRVVKSARGYTVYVRPPRIVGELPEVSVFLTLGQYQRYLLWRDGPTLIQEALPDLSPSEREMLMTGLGDEDFAKMARDEE
jgi:hypothetical protein